ncbi:hypothetical protein [Streptomyces sp. NPDC002845]
MDESDPGAVPDPKAVPETFAFACGDCGHTWEATFQVMFFTDPNDPTGLTTQEYVDEVGHAIRSPLSDAVCPECGGRKVHVMEPEAAERARETERKERTGQTGRPRHKRHLFRRHTR